MIWMLLDVSKQNKTSFTSIGVSKQIGVIDSVSKTKLSVR